jgi:hypothetical protein
MFTNANVVIRKLVVYKLAWYAIEHKDLKRK